ncbi:DUF1566 domain-containing protein [bacterium]|nr:DUF1566 domain-containing protein [bacterium]
MRKLFVLALATTLFAAISLLVSCGDDDDDSNADDDANNENRDDDTADDNHDDDGEVGNQDDDTGNGDDGDDDILFDDLTWQDPPPDEWFTWEQAIEYCENLSFDGYDDWRLPSISELRTLIRGCDATELDGDCGVRDDCAELDCWNDPCQGCPYFEGPGQGGAYWPEEMTGEAAALWSSSPVTDDESLAWYVSFNYGFVYSGYIDYENGDVRCVRTAEDA